MTKPIRFKLTTWNEMRKQQLTWNNQSHSTVIYKYPPAKAKRIRKLFTMQVTTSSLKKSQKNLSKILKQDFINRHKILLSNCTWKSGISPKTNSKRFRTLDPESGQNYLGHSLDHSNGLFSGWWIWDNITTNTNCLNLTNTPKSPKTDRLS